MAQPSGSKPFPKPEPMEIDSIQTRKTDYKNFPRNNIRPATTSMQANAGSSAKRFANPVSTLEEEYEELANEYLEGQKEDHENENEEQNCEANFLDLDWVRSSTLY